jgi:hypothetical protein
MARRRKPEKETGEEAVVRKQLEAIANSSNRSDKTSWRRKMKNMQKLHQKLRPLEDKILELHAQKQPIFDEIQELRETMVTECIHPFDQLVHKKKHIECKFCNRKLSIPKNVKT